MFKRYVKSLETRIENLEAFVCSLSYRLSEIDKLPVEDCPVCKEIKALEATVEPDKKLLDAAHALGHHVPLPWLGQ